MSVISVEQLGLSDQLTLKIKISVGEKIGDLCSKTYGQLYDLRFSPEEVEAIEYTLSESNLSLWPSPRG